MNGNIYVLATFLMKHLSYTTNRNKTFDIAQGIVICLMVIGHSNTTKEIHNFIYLFHVPAFYFISGYFFKDDALNDKLKFIQRKLTQLYKPFVIYGITFLFLSPFFYKLHFSEFQYGFTDFIKRTVNILAFKHTEQLLLPFWFLRSLFTVSILFLFIKYIFIKSNTQISVIATCIILLIIGGILHQYNIQLPRMFQREFIVLFFYAIGYYAKIYNTTFSCKRLYFTIYILTLLGLSPFISIDLVNNHFNSLLGLIFSATLGIYLLLVVSNYINKHCLIIKHYLAKIGEQSLTILALHFCSFKVASYLFIKIYNLNILSLLETPTISNLPGKQVHWIFYSIIGVVLPLMFNKGLILIKDKINNITIKDRK